MTEQEKLWDEAEAYFKSEWLAEGEKLNSMTMFLGNCQLVLSPDDLIGTIASFAAKKLDEQRANADVELRSAFEAGRKLYSYKNVDGWVPEFYEHDYISFKYATFERYLSALHDKGSLCICSKTKGVDNDEDGEPYCIECQKPIS